MTTTYNDVAKALVRYWGWDNRQINAAFQAAGRELSKSRTAAYFKDPTKTGYYRMSFQDIEALVCGALLLAGEDLSRPGDWDQLVAILASQYPDTGLSQGSSKQDVMRAFNDHQSQ